MEPSRFRMRRKRIVKAAMFMGILLSILSFGLLVEAHEVLDVERAAEAQELIDTFAVRPLPRAEELSPAPELEEATFVENGIASWYGPKFHGRRTANGERYDMYAYTAAHKKLPFGTILRVSTPDNDKNVLVRVNDRGPYIRGRIIDLSKRSAEDIGVRLKKVRIEAFLPVRRSKAEHLPDSAAAPVTLLTFNSANEAVQGLEPDSVLVAGRNFSEVMRRWEAMRVSQSDLYFTVVQPTDDEALKTARKWIRRHRGTPHYEYRIVSVRQSEPVVTVEPAELMKTSIL